MSNLQQYQAEIVINNETGAGFMSLRGLARVCGKHQETVRRAVKNYPTKEAKILTPSGLQSVTLYAEDAIAHAIAQFNPELAAQLLQLDIRALLHKLAGWKAPAPQVDYFFNETKGIYIENSTGNAYYTARGAARALGISDTAINNRIRGAKLEGVKMAQVPTASGLQGANLVPAIAVYELAFEFNPGLAKAMGKAGAVLFAQLEAGWKAPAPVSMSQSEAALYTLQLAVENERKLALVETKVERLEAFVPDEGYYTITAYFNYHKVRWEGMASARVAGKALVKLSAKLGHEVKKTHDARYNTVNTYHQDVLRSHFGF